MRIAVLTGVFPSVSETFILRQVTGLLDRGHEVEIYAEGRPTPGEPVHADFIGYGLQARTRYVTLPSASSAELSVWPLAGRVWPPGSERGERNLGRIAKALPAVSRNLRRAPRLTAAALYPREFGYQAASLSALWRLDALASAGGKFDVVHAHFGPVASSLRFAGTLWGAPLVVSFHGYDFSAWPRRHGAGAYARLFPRADVVTVNSDHTRERLIGLGCPPAKLRLLPVGLDPGAYPYRERTAQPEAQVRLATVTRLVPKKGLQYLLPAVAAVLSDHPRLRLDVAGDGPLRQELELLRDELGLGDVVHFHGAVEGKAVRELLERADLFAMVSVAAGGDEEGQGLALQEAQACGLPVLASDHGPLPEGLLPGRSGLVVRAGDVDAIAAGLRELLERPQAWAAMGREGRRFAEAHYDSGLLNDRLVDLYEESLNRGRKPWRARA